MMETQTVSHKVVALTVLAATGRGRETLTEDKGAGANTKRHHSRSDLSDDDGGVGRDEMRGFWVWRSRI